MIKKILMLVLCAALAVAAVGCSDTAKTDKDGEDTAAWKDQN